MPRDLLQELESEYELGVGAVGLLRDGHVDEVDLQRLLNLLHECPSNTDGPMDGRLIRLLWWIPWIAEWQAQRLEQEGKDTQPIRRARDAIFKELERILGVA